MKPREESFTSRINHCKREESSNELSHLVREEIKLNMFFLMGNS